MRTMSSDNLQIRRYQIRLRHENGRRFNWRRSELFVFEFDEHLSVSVSLSLSLSHFLKCRLLLDTNLGYGCLRINDNRIDRQKGIIIYGRYVKWVVKQRNFRGNIRFSSEIIRPAALNYTSGNGDFFSSFQIWICILPRNAQVETGFVE